jgi:hypothetical protein
MGLPVLIGAGVGGLTSALRGKNILKGAALGGALGGVGGGVSSLMNGGSFLQGAGLDGLTGAASDAVSQGAGGLLSTSAENLAPTLIESTTPLASSAVSNVVPNSIDSVMQFNQATGSYLSPESYLAASSANPIYTGTGSLLDKLSMGAQSVGSNFSNPFTNGMGVDNLTGAAQIASMYQPQPLQAAPAGRIEVGQAPTGAIYDALRQSGYTLPKRRETNFSLLG